MLLKDSKGNLFELDDLLSGTTRTKPAESAREDCRTCPYQGRCEEENEIYEDDSRVLFFEINTN